MMSKSREFNIILNECLERMLDNGESLEQCLQDYPEYAGELKPLLDVVVATKKASAVEPHPEFRDRARYQFLSALREMEPQRSRGFFSWQPRWAITVAAVLIVLLAGSGTVFAAGDTMPDDFLYPIKLTTERVQMFFTFTTLGKAELNAKLADKRVDEIVRMADEGNSEKIELTALRLDSHLSGIADLAATGWEAGEATMAPEIEEAAVREGMPDVKFTLPGEEEVVEEEAPVAVAPPTPPPPAAVDEAQLMAERVSGANDVELETDRWSKLREAVRQDAVNQPARLRRLLETVSPSVRATLLQAISLSETSYEKALESLN